jgi:hypothetical protein
MKNISNKATEKPTAQVDNKKSINFIKRICIAIVDSNIFLIFMTLCTIFALFSNDIQMAFLPISTDEIITDLQGSTFFIFAFEIIITVIAKRDYPNSFFFWLDIVGTVTIVQDVDWIIDPLMNIGQE